MRVSFEGGGGDSRWYMFPVRKDLNNAKHLTLPFKAEPNENKSVPFLIMCSKTLSRGPELRNLLKLIQRKKL